MPTPKKGARLGGSPAHQKLILSNLAAQLIEHRAITTTEAKAKTLRPYVEKLITKAKRGDQHARRTVLKKIPNKGIVAILFEELVPAMDSERAGGYTRLIRVGNRKGDNAPLMRIELVMEKVEKKAVVKAAEKTAAKAVAAEAEKDFDPIELVYPGEVPYFDRYDEFVPEELVRKGFAEGVLDIEGMKQRVLSWRDHA